MKNKESTFVLLLALAPFLFLAPTLTSSKTYFMRDMTYLFHPWRNLSSQMIQSGEMPLWNSYEMGGMPFLANCQSAILYPATLLFAHFNFFIALKLFHALHYFLAGFGFFLLARKLGAPPWGSLIGSILFSYNGYLLTRLEFLSVLGSAIWFPWIVLLFFLDESKWWRTLTVSLSLCLSFFAGFPQIFILQAAGSIIFWIWRNPSKKTLFRMIPIFLFFLFLSSIQWIPTVELIKNSSRGSSGIPMEEAATYSLPPDSFFGLITPFRILHHPDRFTGEKYFWIWSAWWGFIASALVCCSLRLRKKRLFSYSIFLSSLGFLWSQGNFIPFYSFIYRHIPFVSLFRYPPVVLYWTVTGISFLAMLGFLALGSIQNSKLRTYLGISLIFLLTCELWFYSRHIQPVILPRYFTDRTPLLQTILYDEPGKILLSGPVYQQRRFAGMTLWQAMMRFRCSFYDLTNLPYRIGSITPSGEPLALASYDRLYEKLKQLGSLEEARPYLNFWNITHYLTYRKLDTSWILMGHDEDLKIYKNPQAYGNVFAFPGDTTPISPTSVILRPKDLEWKNQKIVARFDSTQPLRILFNMPTYPGWKFYAAPPSPSLRSEIVGGYFRSVSVPQGTRSLTAVYDPPSWNLALGISLISFLTLTILGIKNIKIYEIHPV